MSQAEKAEKQTEEAHVETTPKVVPFRALRRLTRADTFSGRWQESVEPGTTVEDIIRPEYWANVVSRGSNDCNLAKGHFVYLTSEADGWRASLYVKCIMENAAIVEFEPGFPVFDEMIEIPAVFGGKYLVGFVDGDGGGWRVVRLSDNKTMQDKIGGQPIAVEWMMANQRYLTA